MHTPSNSTCRCTDCRGSGCTCGCQPAGATAAQALPSACRCTGGCGCDAAEAGCTCMSASSVPGLRAQA